MAGKVGRIDVLLDAALADEDDHLLSRRIQPRLNQLPRGVQDERDFIDEKIRQRFRIVEFETMQQELDQIKVLK